MSLFHLDSSEFDTLRAVVEAAMQDGYESLEYKAKSVGGKKNYTVKLSILSRLLKGEKFKRIKRGGWRYSCSSGSVRNGGNICFLLSPYPLPIPELNKLRGAKSNAPF